LKRYLGQKMLSCLLESVWNFGGRSLVHKPPNKSLLPFHPKSSIQMTAKYCTFVGASIEIRFQLYKSGFVKCPETRRPKHEE
jgi:hypothetical protein